MKDWLGSSLLAERKPQLEHGDGVCVSISGSLSIEFWSASMREIAALGLTPYVYKGVAPPHGRITDNVYIEARGALEQSRALVTVVGDPAGEREGNFGIQELPRVIARGCAGFLYVVSPEEVAVGPAPSGVIMRRVKDEAEFVEVLRTDLSALISRGPRREGSR